MSPLAAEIAIIPARPGHIRTIAERMRQADREEVFAASGRSPLSALSFSHRHSSLAWTALFDGRPEVMWGVGDINILTGIGAPWLLGTDAVEESFRAFLRISRDWPAQLLSRYRLLRNFVDARNTVSLRWLEWLGFRLFEPVEINGHPFRLFEMGEIYV
ncbi:MULTISPECIES: hypothetical protein [unclassified Rhizobium]|uniref:hypothetical protein n=1 Tax=unclassified Rhizobium TaxID=2613769 RepID=UPI001050EE0C|nr:MULTISPECIES: hypothetical protein [unclassified Rhizobium]TCS05303.1 hypothetical protein EV281_103985 [Rhizobium sp. BK418]